MTGQERTVFSHEQWLEGVVLPVNKPAGLTSFDVVRRIRSWAGVKKVGHAGTLDPMATGVLVICTGKATKQVSRFMEMEKEYEGVILLGKRSDTDDLEGAILDERRVPDFTDRKVSDTVSLFSGEIEQVPPLYSALKYKGKRMYQLARSGEKPTPEKRKVFVHKIEITDWNNPELSVRVVCGRGTYIRAIARDVGEILGTGGLLKSLVRTRVGDYDLKDAVELNKVREFVA